MTLPFLNVVKKTVTLTEVAGDLRSRFSTLRRRDILSRARGLLLSDYHNTMLAAGDGTLHYLMFCHDTYAVLSFRIKCCLFLLFVCSYEKHSRGETGRQTDRQTDRQTERQRESQREKGRKGEREREKGRGRERERERESQSNSQRERERMRERERVTESESEKARGRERE